MLFKKSLISSLKTLSHDSDFKSMLDLEHLVEEPFSLQDWLSIITSKKSTVYRINTILEFTAEHHPDIAHELMPHFQTKCGHVETCFNIKLNTRLTPTDTEYFTNKNILNSIKEFKCPGQSILNLVDKLDNFTPETSEKIIACLKSISKEYNLIVSAALDEPGYTDYIPTQLTEINPKTPISTNIYEWISNPRIINETIKTILGYHNILPSTKLNTIKKILNYHPHHKLSPELTPLIRTEIVQALNIIDIETIASAIKLYFTCANQIKPIDITRFLYTKNPESEEYVSVFPPSQLDDIFANYTKDPQIPEISQIFAYHLSNPDRVFATRANYHSISEFLAKNPTYPDMIFDRYIIDLFQYSSPKKFPKYNDNFNIIKTKYADNPSFQNYSKYNLNEYLKPSCTLNKHLQIDALVTNSSTVKDVSSIFKQIIHSGSVSDKEHLINQISAQVAETST